MPDTIAGGLQVAVTVRKSHHAVGIGDIDPCRLVGGIKSDAVGLVQAAGEDALLGGPGAARRQPVDAQLIGAGIGDEQVAVGRHAHGARVADAGGDQLGREARRQMKLHVARHLRALGAVGGRLRRRRLLKVLRRYQPHDARPVGAPIAERLLSLQHRLGGEGGGGKGQDGGAKRACVQRSHAFLPRGQARHRNVGGGGPFLSAACGR
jgi:hypothetical protein